MDEADEAAVYKRKPGDPKLSDLNNDGAIDADHDRTILGQSSPKFGLFLRNSFTYKAFNFAFALEGKFGHHVESSMLGGFIFYDGTRWAPQAMAGNYWTPDNPSGEYPYVNPGRLNNMQTYLGFVRRIFECSGNFYGLFL